MVTNIEYMTEEPLENVITCLNYKIDRVIFFGMSETIEKLMENTKMVLAEACGVNEKEVKFIRLSHSNRASVLKEMRNVVEQELQAGNQIYIDTTGGDEIIRDTFAALNVEYHFPMHNYDISTNTIHEYDNTTGDKVAGITAMNDRKQAVKLTIDQYLALRGTGVNPKIPYIVQEFYTQANQAMINAVWQSYHRNQNRWECFSQFACANLAPTNGTVVVLQKNTLEKALAELSAKKKLNPVFTVHELMTHYLRPWQEADLLKLDIRPTGEIRITYKNPNMPKCWQKAGDILELKTGTQFVKRADEYFVGVHLDWDGVIQPGGMPDVQNELDGVYIKDNILTLISCKMGKMREERTRQALNELRTNVQAFGGKYGKAVLVTTEELGQSYVERAKEYDIELKVMS